MKELLRDPESAAFRKEQVDVREGIVCGEVNARNGFGGLTGFSPYYYKQGGDLIMAEQNNYAAWQVNFGCSGFEVQRAEAILRKAQDR